MKTIIQNFDEMQNQIRKAGADSFVLNISDSSATELDFALEHSAEVIREVRENGKRYFECRFRLPEQDTEEKRRERRQTIVQKQIANRPLHWRNLLENQERICEPDTTVVRFPNATSYLFSTGYVFWAIDPMNIVGQDSPELDYIAEKMKHYHFCILTHSHGDHFQPDLFRRLADYPIKIVVSSETYPDFYQHNVFPTEKFIVMPPGEFVDLYGIRIQCFPGLHREANVNQVASSSFLITLPDKTKLYFPVDIRNFVPDSLPADAMNADYVFSHIWLGRVNALKDEFPCLDKLSSLLTRLNPKTVIMNHLVETSRSLDAMWFRRHAGLVALTMAKMGCKANVFIPNHGNMLKLSKLYTPDPFLHWSIETQNDFLQFLGCSLKSNVLSGMEQCLKDSIPVIEITGSLIARMNEEEFSQLKSCVQNWRKSGHTILSVH